MPTETALSQSTVHFTASSSWSLPSGSIGARSESSESGPILSARGSTTVEPTTWLVSLGLALVVAGVLFAVWAVRTLGPHYDLELEVHQGHEVVRSGPYSLVRHPVYLGLAVHSLGAIAATGSVLLLIGTLGVTLPLFYLRAVTEEGLLRAELGEPYAAYARAVPMLVPFWPR